MQKIPKWRKQENKASQIFQKTNICYPQMRTRICMYHKVTNVRFGKFSGKFGWLCFLFTSVFVCVSGGNKCSFFGKFGLLSFLVTSVLRLARLLYCRQIVFYLNFKKDIFEIKKTIHISKGKDKNINSRLIFQRESSVPKNENIRMLYDKIWLVFGWNERNV